jgi:hypothetical protein
LPDATSYPNGKRYQLPTKYTEWSKKLPITILNPNGNQI